MTTPLRSVFVGGWAKDMYKNGQVLGLRHFKGGKLDGLRADCYENGQKGAEANYKEGKLDGLFSRWYENGQKLSVGNYKDDKLGGLKTSWYRNGQNWQEQNYKDNKLVTTTRWKPNGEKCPITNVVDGNGVVQSYNDEDSTYVKRYVFKDGEMVDD